MLFSNPRGIAVRLGSCIVLFVLVGCSSPPSSKSGSGSSSATSGSGQPTATAPAPTTGPTSSAHPAAPGKGVVKLSLKVK